MRSLSLAFLFLVLSLAMVASAGRPSAAQDKTFAAQILIEHNGVRQKYNVQLLIWDEGLAALAQDWANKIAASGALPPPHRAAGENLFWGTADQWPVKDVLAVWEAEGRNFDRATNTCAPGKNCVHFTQVVWSTTTRLGCGIAKGTTKDGPTDFIVCDYSPPGNLVGQSPFPPATAATTPVAAPTQVARVIPPEPTPATPATTPTPVARVITPAPNPTPASTPNTNTECCQNLRKDVQQLTARVEQLKKQIGESAKLATRTPTSDSTITPTPTPRPVARKITSAATPTPTPVARLIAPAPTPTPVASLITSTVTPTIPSKYCPEEPVTRAEMAKFILLAKHGSTYTPPTATGVFVDVKVDSPNAAWIEQVAKEGITAGCASTNGVGRQYCPNVPATRGEMAVFLMRSIHGGNYTPPAATGGVFYDVGVGHPYAAWIEQLAKEGISKGTSITPPTFSPGATFSRGEMAVFILRSIHGGN